MTSLGKVFTVAMTIASVLFAVSALIVVTSGVNWTAKANLVDGYSFTRSGGENPQYSAIDNVDGSTVKTAKTLPDVIPAALDKKVAGLDTQVKELETRRAALEQRLAVSQQTAAADAELLDQRIARLREQLVAVNSQTADVARQVAAVNEQVAATETQVAARRGDVFRLQTVLEQAELDKLRAERLQGQLSDLIVQLQADLAATRERRRQMKGTGPNGPDLTDAAGRLGSGTVAETARATTLGTPQNDSPSLPALRALRAGEKTAEGTNTGESL